MTSPGTSDSYLETVLERVMPKKDDLADLVIASEASRAGAALLVAQAVRDLCWGDMEYRCDTCGFSWRVWLSLGVEGPSSLRNFDLYVPCPMFAGQCPAWPEMQVCAGRMAHANWQGDTEFDVPRLPPDDVPRFVLPDSGRDCGRLHIPERALVAARKAMN